MKIITIILAIIICIVIIKNIIQDLINQIKTKKSYNKKNKTKKKGYNPENNYFRNNPEHIDMTESYIDSIWEEMKKN